MGHDEIIGTVIETVDLDIQAFDPVITAEGELEGMDTLGRDALNKLRITAEYHHRYDIGFTVNIGGIDKRLGITEFQVPLGLQQDQCDSR